MHRAPPPELMSGIWLSGKANFCFPQAASLPISSFGLASFSLGRVFPRANRSSESYACLLCVGGHGINRAEVFNCQLLRLDFQA